MGYETSLQLINVKFDPARRAELEHRLQSPEKEPSRVSEFLDLIGLTSDGRIEFEVRRDPDLVYSFEADEEGFTQAAIGKWSDAEPIARWLAQACVSGEVILHSMEGDGDAFGWEFKNGRIRYLELGPSGPWKKLPPPKRWLRAYPATGKAPTIRWTKTLREQPALSIRQPWAWLVVNGFKDIENRSWPIRYRGPLLIHAGLSEVDLDQAVIARIERRHKLRMPESYDRGGIVGVVDVVDCRRRPHSPWHHRGSVGWVLANPRQLPFRECRGSLGLFYPRIVSELA